MNIFIGVDKLSKRNNNALVRIKDYKLSRYACYLIAQNADSRIEASVTMSEDLPTPNKSLKEIENKKSVT